MPGRLSVLSVTMTNDERKVIVRQLLQEGRTLSQIQDYLRKEKGDSIMYMELRMLLSEIPDAKLPEKEFSKPVLPPPAPTAAGTPDGAPASKLSISMDQMPAPGSMISGYARFSSGAKAHWFVNETGQLGMEPELGTGKPTPADMQEFTTELRRMLQQR